MSIFPARFVLRALVPALLALPACVAYRPAPIPDGGVGLARDAAAPPSGPLSFEAAVRWAVARNPDLLALRAQAAAVNVDVPGEPVDLETGTDSALVHETSVTIDALSLLGLGVRRADRVAARARRSEALLAHHARAREIAGEIAEA